MLFYHLQTILELKQGVDLGLHSNLILHMHINSNMKHNLLIIWYFCREMDWNQPTNST